RWPRASKGFSTSSTRRPTLLPWPIASAWSGSCSKRCRWALTPWCSGIRSLFPVTIPTRVIYCVGGVVALLVANNRLLWEHRGRVAELALRSRLPAIAMDRDYTEAGLLMTYAADNREIVRRGADYVDKILKGAKPGDLPVEQPLRYALVINLKTARALGLTIPRSVLVRADQLIE
ncbi:MAG: hypothetical protein HY002_03890, partial [Candidatus Rokubacteria bacterium]|nr:hypothetical protein [Candidatus Rokubacteria bacterium]